MILVAGGSGFIGRAVVLRLLEQGHDVAVMTAHPERSRAAVEAMGATPVFGDVQRAETLAGAVEGVRTVVQALSFPSFPVEKPSKRWTFEEFDHLGTERLADAAAEANVERYVYCSGVGAAPNGPQERYRAKWRGEQAVAAAGMEYTIVRPSWVYGPGDRTLNRFLPLARLSPALPVVGDGRQRLQPVFVDDVAEVLARAAAPDGPTGIFEVGGPDVLSMNDVLRTLCDVLGKPDKRFVHVPASLPKAAGFFAQRLPKPPLSVDAVDFLTSDALADIGPLVEAFGVTLTPFRAGLARYVRPTS